MEKSQEVFTTTSQKLFIATKNQIYFGQIKIVIPKTWTNKPEYSYVPQLSDLSQYFSVENGELRVPSVKGKSPFCGEPGKFMYLPVDFLLKPGITHVGPHGNNMLFTSSLESSQFKHLF